MLDLDKAAADLDTLDPSVMQLAQKIVVSEGGYVNDPDDAGGATNHGVSLRHARAQGRAFDLNHDGLINADDIRLVTPQIAAVDFIECFFVEPGLNKLPACLQPAMFDHAINGGPGPAIRLVQQALNALGAKPHLTADGKLGPLTIIAAHAMHDVVGEVRLVNAYVDQRIVEYHRIVAVYPTDKKYLNGWLARANSFRPSGISVTPTPHVTPAPAPEPVESVTADDLNQRELDQLHGVN